jgi:hypothetical protein
MDYVSLRKKQIEIKQQSIQFLTLLVFFFQINRRDKILNIRSSKSERDPGN